MVTIFQQKDKGSKLINLRYTFNIGQQFMG